MISPCIALLRKLATQINNSLGSQLGSKHHSPDLTKDYETIRNRLREYNILTPELGRVIYLHDPSKGEVPNVVNVGLRLLRGPLHDYNKAFQQLQRQRRLTPLANSSWPTDAPTSPGQQQAVQRLADVADVCQSLHTQTSVRMVS